RPGHRNPRPSARSSGGGTCDMTERPGYAYYPVFTSLERSTTDPDALIFETERLLKEWEDRVTVRGFYSTAGFDATVDLLMWWVASSPEDVQELTLAFLRSPLGRALDQTHAFLGVHRPPGTAPDHLPAFLKGE